MNMKIPQSPIKSQTASYIYGRLASDPKAFDSMESVDIVRALFGVAATEPSPVDITEALIRTIEPDHEFEIRNIIRDKSICGAIWRFTSTHKFMVELQKIPGSDGKMWLGLSLVTVDESSPDPAYTARTLVRYNGTKITFCSKSVQSTIVNTEVRDMLIDMHVQETKRLESILAAQKKEEKNERETQAPVEAGSDQVPDQSPENNTVAGEESTPDTQETDGAQAEASGEGGEDDGGQSADVPDKGVAGEASEVTSSQPATAQSAEDIKTPEAEASEAIAEAAGETQEDDTPWKYDCSVLGDAMISTEQLNNCNKLLERIHAALAPGLRESEISLNREQIQYEFKKQIGLDVIIDNLAIDPNDRTVTCVARMIEPEPPPRPHGMVEIFAGNFEIDHKHIEDMTEFVNKELSRKALTTDEVAGIARDFFFRTDFVVHHTHIDDPVFGQREIYRVYEDHDVRVGIEGFEELGDRGEEFVEALQKSLAILSTDDLRANSALINKMIAGELKRNIKFYEPNDYKWEYDIQKDNDTFLFQIKRIKDSVPKTLFREGDLVYFVKVKDGVCRIVPEDRPEIKTDDVELTDPNFNDDFKFGAYVVKNTVTSRMLTFGQLDEFMENFELKSDFVNSNSDGETSEEVQPSNKEGETMEDTGSEVAEAQDTRIDLTDDKVKERLLIGLLGVANPAITHLMKFLKQHLTKIEDRSFAATNGTIPSQVTIIYQDLTYSIVKMMDGEFFRIWVANTNLGLTEHGWIETRDEDGRWFRLGRDIQNQNSYQKMNRHNGRRY